VSIFLFSIIQVLGYQQRKKGVRGTPGEILESLKRRHDRVPLHSVLDHCELAANHGLAIEERQSKGVTAVAREFRKELGLTGNSMVEINLISAAGTAGCGFDWHRVSYQIEEILGISLGDTEIRLNLQVALRVLEFIQGS